MEPVTGVERISKQRWKLVRFHDIQQTSCSTFLAQRCTICDIREGACIQCTKPSCFVAFHATCARKDKLLMPMKSAHGAEPASLTCFCDRHLPVRSFTLQSITHSDTNAPHSKNNKTLVLLPYYWTRVTNGQVQIPSSRSQLEHMLKLTNLVHR